MELTNLIRMAWENGRDYAHDCKNRTEDAIDYIHFIIKHENYIKELIVRLENIETGTEQCNLPVVNARYLKNVRSTKERKSLRTRECYKCGNKINKRETYINQQYRYDKTIMTVSLHVDCFNGR